MFELLQEEHALTIVEVEELLARMHELNARVDSARTKRDELQGYYREKIERAEEIFQSDTADARAEIDSITVALRRYAEGNITGKKRSLDLPSGRLSFRKRQPLYFIGDAKVTNDNPTLIQLAKRLDGNLIKVKETADWDGLKKRLVIDDEGGVCLKDTGEVLTDMRAQVLPDDFTIKTA